MWFCPISTLPSTNMILSLAFLSSSSTTQRKSLTSFKHWNKSKMLYQQTLPSSFQPWLVSTWQEQKKKKYIPSMQSDLKTFMKSLNKDIIKLNKPFPTPMLHLYKCTYDGTHATMSEAKKIASLWKTLSKNSFITPLMS